MPRFVWLILAVCLFLTGTYEFLNAVYWIIIGSDIELGIGFIAGTFVIPLILFYLAYWSWTKTRATATVTEKKE